MIKKFKEFIKESKYGDIRDVISIEELEDQFLRIKEVFNITPSLLIANNDKDDLNSVLVYCPKENPFVFDYNVPKQGNLNSAMRITLNPMIDTTKEFLSSKGSFYWIEIPLKRHSSDKSKVQKMNEIREIKNRIEKMFPIKVYMHPQTSSPNVCDFFIKLK